MARVLRRGDVIWADLGSGHGHEQHGSRPVLVLSREIFNRRSGTVIAAAITSQPQRVGYPLSLKIATGRMPKPSWVKMGQVRTLSTGRLAKRITCLEPEEVDEVVQGLNEIIGE